ncbi:MAG: hypothetical protein U0230_11110 [Polyangiales bacterium]
MGYGNYSYEAHTAIAEARVDLPRQQVFQQRSTHPLMNPKGVRVRESRDSADHPESLGIVFALDVTGSMGDIPDLLARRELPRFMRLLGDAGVRHPQVLFLAFGDATSDQASLQVGQFETTAELMDRWLTFSYLEGGGGGQDHESYEVALHFLVEHVDMDCWRKRRKRGYLFLTGDERPYPLLSRHHVEAIVGDRLDEDVPTEAVVAAVQESFEPFFLIPDPARRPRCERVWRDLLGDRVVSMSSPEDTCFVAAGLVALSEGSVDGIDGIARMVEAHGGGRERVSAVVRALLPYAATIGRDRAPLPPLRAAVPTVTDGASGFTRT